MMGTVTEGGNTKGRTGLRGVRAGVVSSILEALNLRCQLELFSRQSTCRWELREEIQARGKRFGHHQSGSVNLEEGMRLSRREEEDVADPSGLNRGGRAFEGN